MGCSSLKNVFSRKISALHNLLLGTGVPVNLVGILEDTKAEPDYLMVLFKVQQELSSS